MMTLNIQIEKPAYVFIGLFVLSLVYERTRNMKNSCNAPFLQSLLAKTVNVFHHAFSTYQWFGTLLFGHPVVHLMIFSCVSVLWILFQDCILHMWYLDICGLDRKPFYDIFDLLTFGNGRRAKYIALVFVILFDIMLITRMLTVRRLREHKN